MASMRIIPHEEEQPIPAMAVKEAEIDEVFKYLDGAYQLLAMARDEQVRADRMRSLIYWQNEVRVIAGLRKKSYAITSA